MLTSRACRAGNCATDTSGSQEYRAPDAQKPGYETMESNPIREEIKDLGKRATALRGYL